MDLQYEDVLRLLFEEKKETEIRPRVGLLPTGHFPVLASASNAQGNGREMYEDLKSIIGEWADIVVPELVDTEEKAREAGSFSKSNSIDMIVAFPLGYTTNIMIVPAISEIYVPKLLVEVHGERAIAVQVDSEGLNCKVCRAIRTWQEWTDVATEFVDGPSGATFYV